jgi:hypothetical protein
MELYAFCASDKTYPTCCRYTRDTPYLYLVSSPSHTETTLKTTHNRLPCRRNASGAAGLVMVRHALGTSTSRIALRLIFFEPELEPRVATSLPSSSVKEHDYKTANVPDGGDSMLS